MWKSCIEIVILLVFLDSTHWVNATESSSSACAIENDPKRDSVTVERDTLVFSQHAYEFAMIADLDLKSRDPQLFRWKSYLKKGTLSWNKETDKYSVALQPEVELFSETARSNRSMELSELVKFNGRLLAMCDYTGLIFKIIDENKPNPKVLQRWAVTDGDGKSTKPFKMEWATRKDGKLIVGSVGKEWVSKEGEYIHNDAEWIKILTDQGKISNVDWSHVYQTLRHVTNTTYPGYLWHEAVTFLERTRRWYFLPRKASENMPYTPENDERMGTNLLIIASEDFRQMEVKRVGPLEKERGFTSLRHIPGTVDRFIALKVREIGEEAQSWITVFDEGGNILLEPPFVLISNVAKYEGIDFL